MDRRCFLKTLALAASWPGAPASASPPRQSPYRAHFVDIANQAGLRDIVHYGGVESVRYIVEANGCGVAFYDYDQDGWLDILVLNGSRIEGFSKGEEPTNRLYRNNRNGTFTDVTREAGLVHSGWAQGLCIGDYDNDGHDDLFITYWGKNVLYHNNGNGTFTDVTDRAGVGGDPKRWNTGCTFIDYDRDGRLDLFVSNYVDVNLAELPLPGKGINCTWKGVPVFCGPRGLKYSSNILYHNNGDGTFSEVSKQAGIGPANCYGMTAATVDFDNDGWTDIYVACDLSPSLLYRNNHDSTFTEMAVERGLAYSEDGREQAGMGIAIADYDGDGLVDIAKTLFADDMPALYKSEAKGYFTEKSMAAGLQAVTKYVQWGTGFADFDNDTWPDLFYVTGHLYPELDRARPDYPYKGPRILFRNLGDGTFADVTNDCGPGLTTVHSSRGCAFGDFDNDGDVDIVVMNMNEAPSLIRTDVESGNHWLKVKAIGTVSNRTGIGTRVRVTVGPRTQVQEVQSQASYYSVNDLRLHFGLGKATKSDLVEVRWPTGKVELFRNVVCDRLITIQEGHGIIRAVPLR